MIAQVGTASSLTEITVVSDEDYGSGELLLDDAAIEKIMEIEHVKSVEPQLSFSMHLLAGKYEADSMTIIGVTPEFFEDIELERGTIPEAASEEKPADGNLTLLFGNQVLTESFYESATGIYPYWERDEAPDVDVMAVPVFGGISKDDVEVDTDSDTSDTTVKSANDVDPIFTSDDNDFDSEFSADDFSSDDSSDDSSDTGSGVSDSSGNDDESTKPADATSGISDNVTSSGSSLDSIDDSENTGSSTVFTSDVKRVPVKVCGITAGTDSDYTEYSYYCYADIETLKAFIRKNYDLNDIVPEQPLTKDGKPYKDLKYSQFIINVDESDYVEDVLQTIQEMGYHGEANKEWLEEIEKEFMIIEAVLGGIGAVAMLVAAISIANTMTMSTYERTKEIGVMKVLGCSLGNIRSMFLSEAAFIGFIGGVAGVALSFILCIVLNKFVAPIVMEEYGYGEGVNISVIPFWLVMAAIGFSTFIGMIAGFFPAQRATKLSPLAAIRNE
jgi:ABC-type lipoprotein release transport system permease subunit